jgi:hypothetical protein
MARMQLLQMFLQGPATPLPVGIKRLLMSPSDLTVTAQYSINTHAVTFSVPDGNGSLTAEVGEVAITSGDKVDHFSKVVFTAEPDTGYQVKEWTLG